jgi:hypothetical protein
MYIYIRWNIAGYTIRCSQMWQWKIPCKRSHDWLLDENEGSQAGLIGIVPHCRVIFFEELYGHVWNYKEIHFHLPYFHMYIYIYLYICSFCRYNIHIFRKFHVQVFIFDLQDHSDGKVIELDDGNIYRKALYLMVKTMVSCKFSLKPIQWKSACEPSLQVRGDLVTQSFLEAPGISYRNYGWFQQQSDGV